MDKKYRVAVVGGCGQWGRHYLQAYADHALCDVTLVDRSKDRRERFANHFGIQSVYTELNEILAGDVPDIVSLILPVGQSHDAVIACAEAGVKVISCEKPIAVSLADADEMVRVCEERGTLFGCGTACWEVPHLLETAAWVREGQIGQLTAASIPGGLPREVSGGGCVQLTMMRVLTGMEVEWVEGWELPPASGWAVPPGEKAIDVDCPAYGRLGLSGDIVCEVPEPKNSVSCRVWIGAENGLVWLGGPRSVLIQGSGATASPVYPEFLLTEEPKEFFVRIIERLMHAHDTGEMICSGHDYRQALEIAIALKQSSQQNHERIGLPLADRSLRVFPHPYRLTGGDVAGWESIGYAGPPELPE